MRFHGGGKVEEKGEVTGEEVFFVVDDDGGDDDDDDCGVGNGCGGGSEAVHNHFKQC